MTDRSRSRFIARTVIARTVIACAFMAAPLCTPAVASEKKSAPSAGDISEVQAIFRNADLLVACEKGDSAKVGKLLADGVDPNTARTSGATALAYAVAGSHSDVVRILLVAGADPDKTTAGLSPLFLAAENGDLEIVQALVKAGAKVNARLDAVDADMKARNGDTALIAAASTSGTAAVAKALLAAGADVNARADNGKTALMQAVVSENPAVVRVLLDAKADVTPKMAPPEEVDALTLAVGKGRADIVAMLIAAKADAGVRIDGEVTLLEFAILSDHPQVAQLLRKAGAREPGKDRLAALRRAAAE